uniref:Transmembrane 9 superfamily member n=1 Tax=Proboscia inermis TaxID=420281 RepID=A0A7S0GAF1_9STRA
MANENLGEFLAGDRIESSPYLLNMREQMYCEQVCITNLGRAEAQGVSPNKMVRAIRKNYHNNWIVDNLPAASKVEDDKTITTRYWQGFPIGYIDPSDKKAYVHNHVNIEIMYHPVGVTAVDKYRVVRFTVEPFSIDHKYEELDDDDDDEVTTDKAKITNPISSCGALKGTNHTSWNMLRNHKPALASGKTLFTYDVTWVQNDDLPWASRWDIYLSMDDAIPARVHWLSIANSLLIVFVLSAMIAAILIRNLKRDFKRYSRVSTDEEKAEELEEFGWKLVHADVFRPPLQYQMFFCVCCGTGAQLFCMVVLTILFSAIGFLSPSNRGSLIMAQLLTFVALGALNGYVTAVLYKTFKGKSWQNATTFTALFFPGIAFSIFFVLDLFAVHEHSSDAVPFTTIVILLVLWFGISTPLVYLGSYFGYKADVIEFPTNTSSIPRQIPDQPWYMSNLFTLAVGGILPFGACFVELFFILASVWMDQYYYVFGFLLLVFFILVATCAEITVLFCYFQLCGENYHWWWRSFSTAGSTAIWVFGYSVMYFKQLEANSFATYMLYFGYMGLACFGLFLATGCVGVYSALTFNQTIFGSIKID